MRILVSLWFKLIGPRSKGIPTSHPKGPITEDPWASSLYEDRLYFESENKRLSKELKAVRHELLLLKNKQQIALHDAEVASATTMELDLLKRQADIHRRELWKQRGSHSVAYKARTERDKANEKSRDLQKTVRTLGAANKTKDSVIKDLSGRITATINRAEHASERAAHAMDNVKEISHVAAAAESALAGTARNLVSLKADLAEAQVMPPCILTA